MQTIACRRASAWRARLVRRTPPVISGLVATHSATRARPTTAYPLPTRVSRALDHRQTLRAMTVPDQQLRVTVPPDTSGTRARTSATRARPTTTCRRARAWRARLASLETPAIPSLVATRRARLGRAMRDTMCLRACACSARLVKVERLVMPCSAATRRATCARQTTAPQVGRAWRARLATQTRRSIRRVL